MAIKWKEIAYCLLVNAKKGVFQITVDLKSLQIKIAITNFVLHVTKCQLKWYFKI